MSKKYYITAAIPYVNAAPHIGHALEFIQTDTIARYQKLRGKEVFVVSGGDENALKNVKAAEKAGVPIKEFVGKNTELFEKLAKTLNVTFDKFQKGSDTKRHFPSSQKLWKLCEENGDIYKDTYKGLYCVGCEAFYERKELGGNGECHEHPGKKLEHVSETNYFFRLSKYQKKLINLISSDTLNISPKKRKNEVLGFLQQPLKDISISRTNKRARNWGVPVPNDPTQRIYVWFDALNIYQTAVGFGWNQDLYNKWWPADVHVIGKGIIRFHAVYWIAFLLSAKLDLPKELFVHGYVTVDGSKMGKSLGNVVDPFKLVKQYGVDALRYYFLREIPSYGDGDFSERRFKKIYNANLANGLGNLVSRVAKLAEKTHISIENGNPVKESLIKHVQYGTYMNNYRFDRAIEYIWKKISEVDKHINTTRPWENPDKNLNNIYYLSQEVFEISCLLQPFLPTTAKEIQKQFAGSIKLSKPLFPRLS